MGIAIGISWILVLSALFDLIACSNSTLLDLRLLTYNIRFATTSPERDEQPWAIRRPLLASQLHFETAARPEALLCLQEVLHGQLHDLQTDLGREWAHVGVGRDDGRAAGEFSPIFYRPGVWKLQRAKTFWLGRTPEEPSRGWDGAQKRIVTVARFRHLASSRRVVLMCTHLDASGGAALKKSAELLVDIADECGRPSSSAGHLPLFLAGGLNSEPSGVAYKAIVAYGDMYDVKTLVPLSRRHGNNHTYSGFSGVARYGKTIDYLFIMNTGRENMKYLSYAVLANRFDDGVYISDHRGVVVDVQLP